MENMSKFVNSIKELIIVNNLTPAILARESTCPETTISDWLGKSALPKLQNLIKLSSYFNCSIDYILGLSDDKTINRSDTPTTIAIRLQELLIEKDISKYAVGKACGFHSSRFKNWLTSGNIPQTEIVITMSILFECSVEYLFGLSNVK